jgi:hypothetical protein
MLSPQGENLRTASKIPLRPRHDSLGKGISHPSTTNTCRARRRNRPAPATGCFFLLDSGSIRVERMADGGNRLVTVKYGGQTTG